MAAEVRARGANFTPARKQLVQSGYLAFMRVLEEVQKQMRAIPMNPEIAHMIEAGWDAVKEPEHQPIRFSVRQNQASNLILPITETSPVPQVSLVDRYALQADMYGKRANRRQ